MAEDDERREGSKRSGRRDPARNARRDPPLIEGQAEDLTPPVEPIAASGDMMEAPAVEAEHPDVVRPSGSEDPIVGSPVPLEAEAASRPGAEDIRDREPETTVTPPQPASQAPQPAQAKRSPWGVLAALGFVVLAAGILYLFTQLSNLPPDNSAAVADLKTRVSAIETRPATDATGLADRVAKLEQNTSQAQAGVAALGKRVDTLAGVVAGLSGLGHQSADQQAEITALKTDLASVKSTVAALPRPDIGRLEARIGDLDQRFATLQSAVSNIPHIDLGPVTAKVDALESRIKPIEAEVADSRSPEQLAQRRAAPVAVTAQGIVAAIDAGVPFPKEVQALEALGTSPAKLAPLRAVADNGAPSLRDLQTSLVDLRERIVTEGATPVSGSYFDRLMSGASSLVQVRPLGSVVGDTPSAIVARMSDAIGNDALSAALADWHKLPDASQAASKSLADRIKLRLDAEQAAKDIATNAIGAMATPRG